jgi:hypothetical protein
MDKNNGFCIGNNSKCLALLENNIDDLTTIKLFGNKYPSMETFFHCFMKKYTIHLHFTLSNIFMCTNQPNYLVGLNIKHKIISYYPPGIHLAKEILKEYNSDIDLYFLQNHGLIITGSTISDIIYIYNNLFNYFNNLFNNKYELDLIAFKITENIYNKFNKSVVIRPYLGINIKQIINIKYCFPDLAVYINKICQVDNIIDIDFISDIIIFNYTIFLISTDITKLYCMIETLDKYAILCDYYDDLVEINSNQIQNMDQEKYRKNN